MNTIVTRMIGFRFFLTLFLLLLTQAPIVAMSYFHSTFSDSTITNLIKKAYKDIGKHTFATSTNTQTMAYLNREGLQHKLNSKFNTDIKRIGKPFFKNLFCSILKKEILHAKKYRVFYHGQDRIFMLFQDLYDGLYQIAYTKSLKNFILLRIPNKDFGKYKNTQQFLYDCIKDHSIHNSRFDHLASISKQLFCVNASLFGNTRHLGECSFHYFISSWSVSKIDILSLIKNLFSFFKYETYFTTYKSSITQLHNLLVDQERNKTGLLLQLFVPAQLINKLAYRSHAFGHYYYSDLQPEKHPAIIDIDSYRNNVTWTDSTMDKTQFRLLINNAMLNPNSGIKFHRYYNKTNNVKKYQTKLQKLLANIKADIAHISPKKSPYFKSQAIAFA